MSCFQTQRFRLCVIYQSVNVIDFVETPSLYLYGYDMEWPVADDVVLVQAIHDDIQHPSDKWGDRGWPPVRGVYLAREFGVHLHGARQQSQVNG